MTADAMAGCLSDCLHILMSFADIVCAPTKATHMVTRINTGILLVKKASALYEHKERACVKVRKGANFITKNNVPPFHVGNEICIGQIKCMLIPVLECCA